MAEGLTEEKEREFSALIPMRALRPPSLLYEGRALSRESVLILPLDRASAVSAGRQGEELRSVSRAALQLHARHERAKTAKRELGVRTV